ASPGRDPRARHHGPFGGRIPGPGGVRSPPPGPQPVTVLAPRVSTGQSAGRRSVPYLARLVQGAARQCRLYTSDALPMPARRRFFQVAQPPFGALLGLIQDESVTAPERSQQAVAVACDEIEIAVRQFRPLFLGIEPPLVPIRF